MPSIADKRGCLADLLGRRITYLRVSLTDRCNMRCGYCYDSLPKGSTNGLELSNDELIRLLQAFVRVGVNKIRFTGGEVLLREGIDDLIRRTKSMEHGLLVGITTNGLLLGRLLSRLVDAGLNRLNVSLDTLDRLKFERITGVNGFDSVCGAIMRAAASGAFPRVRINTVVIKGVNDDEIERFADWGLSHPLDVRFIEFMPTLGSGWSRERFVSESEIRSRLPQSLEIDPAIDASGGPARTFYQAGRPGRVSFISAVSRSFCGDCNRLRVTARGEIVGCLFGASRVSVRHLLDRNTHDDAIVSELIGLVEAPLFRREPSAQSITCIQPSMRGVGG